MAAEASAIVGTSRRPWRRPWPRRARTPRPSSSASPAGRSHRPGSAARGRTRHRRRSRRNGRSVRPVAHRRRGWWSPPARARRPRGEPDRGRRAASSRRGRRSTPRAKLSQCGVIEPCQIGQQDDPAGADRARGGLRLQRREDLALLARVDLEHLARQPVDQEGAGPEAGLVDVAAVGDRRSRCGRRGHARSRGHSCRRRRPCRGSHRRGRASSTLAPVPAHCPSPPPAMTGVPARRPVAAAAAVRDLADPLARAGRATASPRAGRPPRRAISSDHVIAACRGRPSGRPRRSTSSIRR